MAHAAVMGLWWPQDSSNWQNPLWLHVGSYSHDVSTGKGLVTTRGSGQPPVRGPGARLGEGLTGLLGAFSSETGTQAATALPSRLSVWSEKSPST